MSYYAGTWKPLNVRAHQVGSIPVEESNARLMVMGLDDEGNLEVLQNINKVSQTIDELQPHLMFFFVHGWRGDASKENEIEGDLGRYKNCNDEIAITVTIKTAHVEVCFVCNTLKTKKPQFLHSTYTEYFRFSGQSSFVVSLFLLTVFISTIR